MNLPNRLTVFRIALIPVIILVYIFPYCAVRDLEPKTFLRSEQVSLSVINLIVLGIYLVAAFTDFLDGNIARKIQQHASRPSASSRIRSRTRC
jgi:CDP-diacylglycerol--glycerol-3-phosphate 3-phosphatidyltransferase